MSQDAWDYIVVGAGHNGLSAACTLAEGGASVLVLEKQPFIGGLSHSHAHLPAAPDHLLSLGAMDDMFMAGTGLAGILGLQRYGYQSLPLHHPYGWIGEDGETLLLFDEPSKTAADIRRFSPRDARAFLDLQPALSWILDMQDLVTTRHPARLPKAALLKKALKLAPSRKLRSDLGRILTANVVELVADTFESDQMRALVTYWASMIGPLDADATGFYIVALAAVSRGVGVRRPVGGMGGLMNAFAAHLQAHGGEIRTATPVARVVVDGGVARGVVLADGAVLEARHGVLSTLAPQLALGSQLEADVLDSATRAKIAMIPASGNNSATFKIDMALSGRATYRLGEQLRQRRDGVDIRRTALMTGTFSDQLDQLRAIRSGSTIESPPVYMAVLSATDLSIAPEGQDVVYLACNVPAAPAGGWDDELRERYAKTVLGSVERYLGGLDTEIGRVTMSPADYESQFGAPNGSYFHVDMTPFRLAMRRPAGGLGGYTTPVASYYLAGAGSHPGGGVSGWPGRLAAQTALEGSAGQ